MTMRTEPSLRDTMHSCLRTPALLLWNSWQSRHKQIKDHRGDTPRQTGGAAARDHGTHPRLSPQLVHVCVSVQSLPKSCMSGRENLVYHCNTSVLRCHKRGECTLPLGSKRWP